MSNEIGKDLLNDIVLDHIDQGVIFVDTEGVIKICNQKALEIIGLSKTVGFSHGEGVVEEGDIVCIASNSIGTDDGNIDRKILSKLGYKGDIPYGKPFVLIGRYMTNEPPKVKIFNSDQQKMRLSKRFEDTLIDGEIDLNSKTIDICFNSVSYKLNYIFAVGHMLIVDSHRKKVKFYQSRGFTARNESIHEILMGHQFRTKGEKQIPINIIGNKISTVFKQNKTIEDVIKSASGDDINYNNEFRQVNGIPTLCSLIPLSKNEKRYGALLKIEDVSEFHKAMVERDRAVRQLKVLENEVNEKSKKANLLPEIIGRSYHIQDLRQQAHKASLTNSNVLLLGESGTGKTHLAYAIHKASQQSEEAFIHVNCSAIPGDLLESELFGYEKGAFTGAKNEGKIGLFQRANGGTIFLDEIGEIDYQIQAKLLKVLQDKTFYKVGGIKEIKVNVRVITATNKDLEKNMEIGKFRSDLFYRINVFPIFLAPLRERKEDIEDLTNYLIPKICRRMDVSLKNVTREALIKLSDYSYPGNIRELENMLERSINISIGDNILPEDIVIKNKSSSKGEKIFRTLKEYISETEMRMIKEVLRYYNNDKEEVMKALGIKKTALYDKLKHYGIDSSGDTK